MPLPKSLAAHLALPVIGSPLFIVSNPDLVIAQCLGGIVGSFPALNARPKEELEAWILRIKTALAAATAADPSRRIAPFAVNQIVHKSNDRLAHDVEVCVRHQVPIIITSLQAPAPSSRTCTAMGDSSSTTSRICAMQRRHWKPESMDSFWSAPAPADMQGP